MASEDVRARLVAEGEGPFVAAFGRARQAVTGVGEGGEESRKGLLGGAGGMIKAAAAAGVAWKAYGTLKDSVKTTVDLAKATAGFSRVTGISSKESQAWVSVAQSRGIEVRQLQMGMATLGRNLGGLGTESKASAAALKTIGLSSEQLNKLPTADRMGAIADAFKTMPDGIEKAALAQKLFGRSGQQLLPVLNQGADGLQGELDTAKKLVPPLETTGKKSLELAKQQREVGLAMTGVKTSIGSALIPILVPLVKALVPIISAFAELIQKSVPFRLAIIVLGAAFAVMWLAALGPIPLIVAGVAAVALGFAWLYQKVKPFRDVIDWIANFVKANWPIIIGLLLGGPLGVGIAALATNFGGFRDKVVSVFNAVKGAVAAAIGFVVGRFNWLVSELGKIPGKIAGLAKGLFTPVINAAKDAVKWVWHQFTWLIDQIRRLPSIISGFVSGLGSSIGGALTDAVKSVLPGPLKKLLGTGGIVAAQTGLTAGGGTTALVGERGPELANLPAGTRITPLPPPSLSPSQLMGGGGQPIVTQVFLDRRQIAEALGSFTADQQNAR
jgi:phage-related protein